MPRKVYLSMGAGTNTAACLIKYADLYDAVIFADTGDEEVYTYDYIERYMKPFCAERKIPWHTVRHPEYKSLLERCLDKKMIPDMHMRWCTTDHKKQPIRFDLRQLGHSRHNPADVHIGFAFDEPQRLGPKAYIDEPLYQHKVYPLVEDRITRAGCEAIIKEHGWPPAGKSGCDFCPFKGRRKIQELSYTNPQKFKQLLKLERITGLSIIPGKPLQENYNFDDFDKMTPEEEEAAASCDDGVCWI